MSTYICPHCLAKFNYDEIWFKCDSPNTRSETTHQNWWNNKTTGGERREQRVKRLLCDDMGYDTLIEKYQTNDSTESDMEVMKRDSKNGFFKYQGRIKNGEVPKQCKCYYCGERTFKYVCPNPFCHKPLEAVQPNDKQYIIDLAGGKSSGKTYFLGALIYAATRELPHLTNSWVIETNDTADKLVNNFKEVTKRGMDTQGSMDEQYDPAIVSFRKMNADGTKTKYSFIFFDVAGEIFGRKDNSATSLVKTAKQFSCPDFVIYLTDPARLDKLCKEALESDAYSDIGKKYFKERSRDLGDTTMDNTLGITNSRMISIIHELITQVIMQYGTEEEFRIADKIVQKIPMACCISMCDFIADKTPNGKERIYLKPSTVTDDLDYPKYDSEVKEKDRALRDELLHDLREEPYVNTIKGYFPTNRFFALSARGTNEAGEIDLIKDYKAINILDPFIWIISQVNPEILRDSSMAGSGDDYDDSDYSSSGSDYSDDEDF